VSVVNWKKLTSREVRKSLYLISLAVIPLLVFYGVITEDSAPLWVALVGSVLAPTLALTHLSPKEGSDA
jgi:hypothetical protein